jgi:hypothetical protein
MDSSAYKEVALKTRQMRRSQRKINLKNKYEKGYLLSQFNISVILDPIIDTNNFSFEITQNECFEHRRR